MSTSEMYEKIDAALVLFGKKPIRDKTFPTFQDFFNHLALKYISYDEITKKFKLADKCTNPIPPAPYWPHAALCLALAERMRTVAGVPIWIKYAYRNSEFNKLVTKDKGETKNSDHLKFALDIVFQGKGNMDSFFARDAALLSVIEPLWKLGIVELTYGVGSTEPLIHVGVFCGRGQHRWRYQDGRVVGF